LPKTKITSLKKGKKKITVKWKKKKQITGYQIQYSTDKKFKKNRKTVTVKAKKTSRTITKLKSKKKYYVRIRTYKTVKSNGKTKKSYSGWSAVKSVKTK
jgi:phosphodiesterase/alkaline phosphatase D-like protein